MDVGARLKEARMEKGLSLDTLQETTKIQKRYLVAIEEGNFNILPGKFYSRAFIKEYANAVGLNPDELLAEHKSEIPDPTPEVENEIRYTRMEKSRRASEDRSSAVFSTLPKIIVVLLVIGILGAAVWFYIQSQSTADPTEIEQPDSNVIITNPTENNDVPVSEDEEDREENETESNELEETDETEDSDEVVAGEVKIEVVEVGTGSPPESTFTVTNPSEELIFNLESAGNVWVDVTNGSGENFYNSFVNAENSPITLDLTGEETVHFNIGSAPNLQFQINGVAFEYPIDPNERDHQRLIFNIE